MQCAIVYGRRSYAVDELGELLARPTTDLPEHAMIVDECGAVIARLVRVFVDGVSRFAWQLERRAA